MGKASVEDALRRAQVIEHLLATLRRAPPGRDRVAALLAALAEAVEAGAAVIDPLGDGVRPMLREAVGTLPPHAPHAAARALAAAGAAAGAARMPDGHRLLACAVPTRFGEQLGLVLLRGPGDPAWRDGDRAAILAASALLGPLLEHKAIQLELARQARTDPLTGLFDRRAFMEELARHIDRLERDGLPGALLLLDLDRFAALNAARGQEAGDEALRRVARLLRGSTRPADLLARVGGDSFAAWLNGADEFAAAERAEDIRAAAATLLTPGLRPGHAAQTISIGIAVRWAGDAEDGAALLQRAEAALRAARSSGGGQWRVAPREATG